MQPRKSVPKHKTARGEGTKTEVLNDVRAGIRGNGSSGGSMVSLLDFPGAWMQVVLLTEESYQFISGLDRLPQSTNIFGKAQ